MIYDLGRHVSALLAWPSPRPSRCKEHVIIEYTYFLRI